MLSFYFTEKHFVDPAMKKFYFDYFAPLFYRMKFSCCVLVKKHVYGYGMRELQSKLSISTADITAFMECKAVPNPSQLFRFSKWMNLETTIFFPPSPETMPEFSLEKL